jgi:hypothetical protein
MRENFHEALQFTLQCEGGYVNDPLAFLGALFAGDGEGQACRQTHTRLTCSYRILPHDAPGVAREIALIRITSDQGSSLARTGFGGRSSAAPGAIPRAGQSGRCK